MGFLEGKKILITGVMSDRSIAYGIACAMAREGAKLIFSCLNEKFSARVTKITQHLNPAAIIPCDVNDDEQINNMFAQIEKTWGKLDSIIHSIAFAPADQLGGDFIEQSTREGFKIAHETSAYSLIALAKAGEKLLNTNGSILALSYLGAERTVTNYNMMGVAKASLEAAVRYAASSMGPRSIRVNAISAGPIRTLAASGIKGFRKMLDYNESVSPLRRNVTIDEVGNVAAFLCSDLASGITGEITYVDAGFNIVAVPPFEA